MPSPRPPHYYHYVVILNEYGTAASVDPSSPTSTDSPSTSELTSEPTAEATTDLGSTSEPDGGGGTGDDGDENVWLIAGPVIAVAVILLVAAIVGAFLFYRYFICIQKLGPRLRD